MPDEGQNVPELRIGVQLASLQLPFRQALHTAGELGADAVEIDARQQLKPRELTQTGLRQLRKMLEDRNLRVCAVSFRTRRGYDVSDDLDRRIEATKDAMRLAYRLGAPVVVNHVGRIPTETSEPAWDLLVQALGDLGHFGQREGAFLAADTGAEDPTLLARLIEAMPAGGLAVNLDPASLLINGFSPREAVRVLGRHTMHVYARDGVRDLARGRGVETPLGRGSVDFPELIGALEEFDYHGHFTVGRPGASDPISEFGQAVRYLRAL
jgi:sugar phosphate isomerase/epimerase